MRPHFEPFAEIHIIAKLGRIQTELLSTSIPELGEVVSSVHVVSFVLLKHDALFKSFLDFTISYHVGSETAQMNSYEGLLTILFASCDSVA